jgi:nuclear polyadenylated RNA-binding protein 3
MTDNQPEVVATADLTLESPNPINLSSPALVPTLQDQAENLYTMSLSPPAAGLHDPDNATTDQQRWADEQDQNPGNSSAEVPQADATASNESNSLEKVQDETRNEAPDADGDEYAKNFDSPEAVADDSQQEDIHKVYEPILNTEASDLLKNQPVVEARSEPLPSTLVQSLQQSTSIPETNQPAANSHGDANGEPAMSLVQASHTAVATVSENAPTENVVQAEDAIDIQALVDNITARAAASESNQTADPTSENGPHTNLSSTTQSASLPPRPPSSQQPTSAHLRAEERKFQPGASHPNAQSAIPNMPPVAGMPYPYPAPGTVAEISGSHPPSVMSADPNVALSMPVFNPSQVPIPNQDQSFDPQQQQYDLFLQEERKYVSEAKWDRFPDGSRLFIGMPRCGCQIASCN